MTTRARTKKGEKQSNASEAKRSPVNSRGPKPRRPEQVREQASAGSKEHALLRLQRSHGNQAVQRLVNEQLQPTVQPKLEVRPPDDKYEREADRVAEQVMRQPTDFGRGEYAPGMRPGQQLIAHGLPPTVQQGNRRRGPVIQRQTDPNRSQSQSQTQAHISKQTKKNLTRAIPLLEGALPNLNGANKELLDLTIEVLKEFFPTKYGIRDAQGKVQRRSARNRWINTIQRGRMEISRVFVYDVHLYLSNESSSAAGRFQRTPGGGQIIVYTRNLSGQSPEAIASLLVHEVIHMLSHMRQTMLQRHGPGAAAHTPTRGISKLLNPDAVANQRRPMENHFKNLVRYINESVQGSNLLVDETAESWADHLVDEVIAYLFADEVEDAVATHQAQQQARSERSGVGVTPGSLIPMRFLTRYLTEYWLQDRQRRDALKTPRGRQIINGMAPDLQTLVNTIQQRF